MLGEAAVIDGGGGTNTITNNSGATIRSLVDTAVVFGSGDDTFSNSGTVQADAAGCHGIDLGNGTNSFSGKLLFFSCADQRLSSSVLEANRDLR